jgi:putative salt-induced outer membrane protein YdiY
MMNPPNVQEVLRLPLISSFLQGMGRWYRHKACFVASLGVVCLSVFGDQLVFENGDQLTGTLIEQRDGIVVFDSDLLGRMEVDAALADLILTDEEGRDDTSTSERDADAALPSGLVPVLPEAVNPDPEPGENVLIVDEETVATPVESEEKAAVAVFPSEDEIDRWIRWAVNLLPDPMVDYLRVWESSLSIGYTWDSGSRDRQRLDTQLESKYTGSDFEVRFAGRYRYGVRGDDDGGERTDLDRYSLENRSRLNLQEDIFVQGLTRYAVDGVRSVRDEFTQSVGVGWEFLNNGRTKASVTPSLSGRYRQAHAEEGEWETLTTLYQDLDHRLSDRLRIEQEAQVSIDPTTGEEASYDFSAELRAGLTEYLVGILRYEIDYDAQLEESRTDRTFSFNFGVEI